jgi:hypothetical protein
LLQKKLHNWCSYDLLKTPVICIYLFKKVVL